MKNTFLLFILMASFKSFAGVNLQMGSWEWSSQILNTELNYNSRSLYQGWWGMGWCSELELKVEINKGSALAKDCQRRDLKAEISIGGFKSQVGPKIYHFDTRGRLVKIENTKDLEKNVHILWNDSIPRQIYTQNRAWILEFDQNQNLMKKMYSKIGNYDFSYVGRQLASVKSQNNWTFIYDTQGNMTYLQAQGQILRLRYDSIADRVLQIQAHEGCSTKYDYVESQTGKSFHLVTTVQKKCLDFAMQTKQVQSQFEILAGSSAILKTVKEVYL